MFGGRLSDADDRSIDSRYRLYLASDYVADFDEIFSLQHGYCIVRTSYHINWIYPMYLPKSPGNVLRFTYWCFNENICPCCYRNPPPLLTKFIILGTIPLSTLSGIHTKWQIVTRLTDPLILLSIKTLTGLFLFMLRLTFQYYFSMMGHRQKAVGQPNYEHGIGNKRCRDSDLHPVWKVSISRSYG